MTIFLILAPFATFALLMLVTSAAISLFAGAAIAAAIIGYEVFRGRSIKMLAAGAVIMFSALGGYIIADRRRLERDRGPPRRRYRHPFHRAWHRSRSARPSRCNMPARRSTPKRMKMPGFMRANYIISWAWTGAFVLMLIANLLMIYMPSLPFWVGLGIGFAARNSAVYFTKWYPEYRRAKYGTAPASALVSPS